MNVQNDGLGTSFNGILGLAFNPSAWGNDPYAINYV
jgi:hypothetical protein